MLLDDNAPPIVQPPAGVDVYIHYGGGLGQIPPRTKLPSGAIAWTFPGCKEWFQPSQFPLGQKTGEEEVIEKAEAEADRIRKRQAAAKFDERGRVPSITEHFAAMMRDREEPGESPEPTGPPPGYRR